MKKGLNLLTLILLLLATSFSFTSCSDGDDNDPPYSEEGNNKPTTPEDDNDPVEKPVIPEDDNSQYEGTKQEAILGTWLFKTTTIAELQTNALGDDVDQTIKAYLEEVVSSDYQDGTYLTFYADSTFIEYTLDQQQPISKGSYLVQKGVLTRQYTDQESHSSPVFVEDGILYMEEDYSKSLNDLTLEEVRALGILNPITFRASKANVLVSYDRYVLSTN